MLTLFLLYVLFTSVLLFVALFGRSAKFSGTFVETAYHFVAGGWFDGLLNTVEACCGSGVVVKLVKVEEALCYKKNPVLPALYFALIAVTYWIYNTHVFSLLPTQLTPEWHRYTGTAAVLVCFVFWALAAFSDPGKITPETLDAWASSHPPGNELYPIKECATCLHTRPARSRHCSMCNACIGRHDHHCGWINNCVGSHNMRWFLGFVFSNFCMMSYAAILCPFVLYGHLLNRGLQTGTQSRLEIILTVYRIALQSAPLHLMLSLALGLAAAIMLAFSCYHAYNISHGVTGTEWHKIGAMKRASHEDGKISPNQQRKWWQLWKQRSDSNPLSEFPYKGTFLVNWTHVLFPGKLLKHRYSTAGRKQD